MSREVYNNLIVIVNIVLMFAYTGLAVHAFHSHADVVEGSMFIVLTLGHTVGFGLGLYKLFKDRAE